MKKIIMSLAVIFATYPCFSQEQPSPPLNKKEQRKQRIDAMAKQEEEGVITYTRHTVFGGKLTTDGYGGFVEIGRAKSISRSSLFQLEIVERKHVKEEKQQQYSNVTPFIYGKINYFYPVKLGMQQQFLLGNKGNKNGVSVTGSFGGGLALGLLRPYYVDVLRGSERIAIKYESADSLDYLNSDNIIGGSGFGKGWSEMQVVPGVYVKPALRFDYGKYNEMVNAIEVGLTGEFYSKTIPQLVYNKQKRFFLNAYVSIVFGRRK